MQNLGPRFRGDERVKIVSNQCLNSSLLLEDSASGGMRRREPSPPTPSCVVTSSGMFKARLMPLPYPAGAQAVTDGSLPVSRSWRACGS
jgi:hypothetical protein